MKEKIKKYIDNLFSNVEKTKNNEELKEEVVGNLYEKYNDLVSSGMTEQEAYEATVNNIGDLSELFEKKTTDQDTQSTINEENDKANTENDYIPLYDEKTSKKKKLFHDIGLTLAIVMYIFSLFPVILFESDIAVCAMFLIAAIATGMIIYISSTNTILIRPSFDEGRRFQIQKKRSLAAIMLSASVVTYILSVCAPILIKNEKIAIIVMFSMIALATSAIIIRATTMSDSSYSKRYPINSNISDNSKISHKSQTKKKTPSQIVFSILSGIYWALVCIIYFAYSFVVGNWEISWIIFIYGGLLYMITHGIFNLIIGKHRAGSIVKIVICSLILATVLPFNALISDSFSLGNGELSLLFYDDNSYESGQFDLKEQEITSIDIEWVDGSANIKYWDKDYISVTESSTSELSSKNQLRYKINGKELSIKYRAPSLISLGNIPSKELTVYLPHSIDLNTLKISAVNANIYADYIETDVAHINNVAGKVELINCIFHDTDIESVSGTIRMSGISNDIDVDTVSGEIEFQFITSPENIDIDSVSANATINLPSDISGFEVKFDSVSGHLKVPDDCRHRDDEYIFGNGIFEINFDSVSGNLTVKTN